MDSGYYAACTALKTQSSALELIANNVANINTTGYPRATTFVRVVISRRTELNGE